MSVNLSISTEEAQVLVCCLRYLRMNIAPVADGQCFRFVGGKPFEMSVRQGISLDFLKDYIETTTEQAINSQPFNPFVKMF